MKYAACPMRLKEHHQADSPQAVPSGCLDWGFCRAGFPAPLHAVPGFQPAPQGFAGYLPKKFLLS